ncbi:MAG: chromate transporter [Phycisphaerales bacterium]|nr:MAG: chromate transporter [Phycisphaerales bacterium]
MILLKLFIAFLKIGLFAFGGAYSFVPMIEREVVQNNQWLAKEEFLEILGIVKVFPGAISIKFATYTGYKVAGVPGAIVANFANILAPVLFIMAASLVYSKYKDVPFVRGSLEMIQYAVFAMIIAVGIQLVDKVGVFELKNLFVVLVAFALFALTKIHPAFIIVGAAVYGGLINSITST